MHNTNDFKRSLALVQSPQKKELSGGAGGSCVLTFNHMESMDRVGFDIVHIYETEIGVSGASEWHHEHVEPDFMH